MTSSFLARTLERPERVSFFAIDPVPVSSSDLRVRAAAGETIDTFVPAAVAAEIAVLGLYRNVDSQ